MFFLGQYFIPTVIILAIWGLLTGIINDIIQFWVVSAAGDSLDFANGVFLSMGNLGITLGTVLTGAVLDIFGVKYILFAGVIVIILALFVIFVRIEKYGN